MNCRSNKDEEKKTEPTKKKRRKQNQHAQFRPRSQVIVEILPILESIELSSLHNHGDMNYYREKNAENEKEEEEREKTELRKFWISKTEN